MVTKTNKWKGPIARSEIRRLSGCLALPKEIEDKAINYLDSNKEYTSRDLISILIAISNKLKFNLNKDYLSQTKINLKIRPEKFGTMLEQCPECGSKHLMNYFLLNEVVCGDCGLVQMNKEEYFKSKESDKFQKSFYEIMKSKPIKELLSINQEGEKILKLIEQIDDEHHGYLIVVSQMFKEYVKKYHLEKKLNAFLNQNET